MKSPRDNKFGSLDFLSKPVSDSIKSLITSLEKDGISYDIYYGYPIIDENDRKEYVACPKLLI